MDRVLGGIQYKHTVWYLVDIVVCSETFRDHLNHLQEVFDRLREARLTLKLSQCKFLKEKVQFGGHVSYAGLEPDPEKVTAT